MYSKRACLGISSPDALGSNLSEGGKGDWGKIEWAEEEETMINGSQRKVDRKGTRLPRPAQLSRPFGLISALSPCVRTIAWCVRVYARPDKVMCVCGHCEGPSVK